MCYNFISLETTEFVLKQVNCAGKALTSANTIIMVVYQKFFIRALDGKSPFGNESAIFCILQFKAVRNIHFDM